MRVRWHGHACFEFGNSEHTVVIDPHDGKSLGIKPPAATADVVLMTHSHYDHKAAWVIGGNHKDFLSVNGPFEFENLSFRGFSTFHDEKSGRERGLNTMYSFVMDNISVCHCGDLGCIPEPEIISRPLPAASGRRAARGNCRDYLLCDFERMRYNSGT